MSLGFVLQRVQEKMGMNASQPSQRETLVGYANEAALELYDSFDPPGCLLEETFKVNGDQTISCPYYVGQIRGIRESTSWIAWHINKMRPRYNQFNWKDCWRNIRLKNSQALAATVTNESIGTLTVEAVEDPPIQVTITGATANSAEANEIVVMSATSVPTVNQYTNYHMIRKDRVNQFNIELVDVDNKFLAIIPNNMIESSFQIYDVSQCPWIQNSMSTLDHYLEILFKKTLPYYENDSDQFPAQGYDYIWINKILQLWAEDQGKTEEALGWDSKATRSAARKKQNHEQSTEDKVSVVANPHDSLLPRIRQGIGRNRYWRGRYF